MKPLIIEDDMSYTVIFVSNDYNHKKHNELMKIKSVHTDGYYNYFEFYKNSDVFRVGSINNKMQFHSLTSPSFVMWQNGSLGTQSYYINGKYYSKADFDLKINETNNL